MVGSNNCLQLRKTPLACNQPLGQIELDRHQKPFIWYMPRLPPLGSVELYASLEHRLSRTATRRAVSSSLGGNPSAKANVATCVQVVTNAGIVVVGAGVAS